MDIEDQSNGVEFVLELSFPHYLSFNYVDKKTDEVLYSADLHKDMIPDIIESLKKAYRILDNQTILMN